MPLPRLINWIYKLMCIFLLVGNRFRLVDAGGDSIKFTSILLECSGESNCCHNEYTLKPSTLARVNFKGT